MPRIITGDKRTIECEAVEDRKIEAAFNWFAALNCEIVTMKQIAIKCHFYVCCIVSDCRSV